MTIKSLIVIVACCLFSLTGMAQVPATKWYKLLGGSLQENANCVLNTADGGFLFVGNVTSTGGDVVRDAAHANTILDVWVVKLDSTGAIMWQKLYGGSSYESANSVIEIGGSYYVSGYATSANGDVTGFHGGTGSDFWVMKLDAGGAMLWQKTIGGTGDEMAYSITGDKTNGVLVAGYTKSTDGDVTNNHGGADGWIVNVGVNGIVNWKKTFGGTGDDYFKDIKGTNDGGSIVTGYTTSSDGDVTTNKGMKDVWIVKLTSTGAISWQKTFGGTNDDEANAVRINADGSFIVAGNSFSANGDVTINKGSGDALFMKISSTGALLWQKTYGGTGFDNMFTIETTADSGYIAGGQSTSANGDVPGGPGINSDCWIVKLNKTGSIVWQKTYGGNSNDQTLAITKTTDGGYLLAGDAFSSDLTGYHGPYSQDAYIIRLGKDLTVNVPTGIGEVAASTGIIVFPTMAEKDIHVQLPAGTILNGVSVALYNMNGQLQETTIRQEGSGMLVHASGSANGNYLLKVKTPLGISVHRVVLVK